MKLRRLLQKISPRFERRDISKVISSLKEEINMQTLPSYERAVQLLSGSSFKGDDIKKFERDFTRQFKGERGSHVEIIARRLSNLDNNLDVLEKMVNKFFARDVVKSSLTYSKLQVLQALDIVAFCVLYSRLHLVLVLEQSSLDARGSSSKPNVLGKGDMEWLAKHRITYIVALSKLSVNSKEVEKQLAQVPDILASENDIDSVISSTGLSRLNPMGEAANGIIPTISYWIGTRMVDYQYNRYKAAKETKRLLEYQLLDLEAALEGTSDPKTQKAMEVIQDEITKLNRQIRKMEEEAL